MGLFIVLFQPKLQPKLLATWCLAIVAAVGGFRLADEVQVFPLLSVGGQGRRFEEVVSDFEVGFVVVDKGQRLMIPSTLGLLPEMGPLSSPIGPLILWFLLPPSL